MIKSLIFFARFYLFWLLFFFLDRIIFTGVFLPGLPKGSLMETLAVFYHGLRLDLAMTAYLAAIPLLFLVISYGVFPRKTRLTWIKAYNTLFIILCSLIGVINLNIYREWGTKINARAIGFAFNTPREAMASSAAIPVFSNLLFLALLLTAGLLMNKWIVRKLERPDISPLWARIAFGILLTGFNFLIIRGGIGVSPNNQSMAYYSDKLILNHAAVNTEWNLVADLLKSKHTQSNPFVYYPQPEAARLVRELYAVKKDTTIRLLNTSRPNVVLFIIESFTADLTRTLGNEPGITPAFDSLVRQGVLFSKIYAAGNRTDKGFIGSLAGQATIANENMVKWTDKTEKLPSLSRDFYQKGYQTSFFYGGQSEFDNYKAFVLSHDFESLTDKSSFKAADMNSKWGAFDGVVFNRQLRELNKGKQPFFSTVLTLTNHEPFELPGRYRFGSGDNLARFKSTAYYTDSCINDFLKQAKKQPWYSQTLFIFVADHGHILPKGREEIYIPERYHIPLLFYGDVIKKEYRGKIYDKVGSQTDIAATLLHQLDMDAGKYRWSKNLMNPETKPFAFFSWDNGMGFIDNRQCVTFDNVGKMILYNDHPEDKNGTGQLLKTAKSYLQEVYQVFLDL